MVNDGLIQAIAARDSTLNQHKRTPAADRRVTIIIKDAHDYQGPGMTFEIKFLDKLKPILDSFKAASCKKCRAVDELRFKTVKATVYEWDTPQKVSSDRLPLLSFH